MKIRINKGPGLAKAQVGGQQDPTQIKVDGVVYTPSHPQWAQVLADYKQTKAETDELRNQVNNYFSNNAALNQKMNNFNQGAAQQLGRPTLAQTIPSFTNPVVTAPAPTVAAVPTLTPAVTKPALDTTPITTKPVIQSMQQTAKIKATQPEAQPKPFTAADTKPAGPALPGYTSAFTPFGTLATLNPNTGMIDNPLGTVSKMDTRALGFNDDGTRNDTQTLNINELANNASKAMRGTIAIGSMFTNYLDNRRKERAAKNYMINNQLSDNLYTPQETDRGDYVQTGMTTGMLRPDDYVANKGMFAEQGGTINNPTMKIRITGKPNMAYGGQFKPAGSLDVSTRNVYTQMPEGPNDSVSNTMPVVDRDQATIEAEKGEVLYGDVDKDGVSELMHIAGKPHSQGGTPTDAPNGSFIYSKKLKEKDPAILKEFNRTYKRGGVSYSDIAKQYPINKYKAIIEDPNADPLAKSTAQLMVKNYQAKLDKLAFAQEASKGFPDGPPQNSFTESLSQAAYGGLIKADAGLDLTAALTGANPYIPLAAMPVVPYAGNKDGKKTPTNKDNKFNEGPEYFKQWEDVIPGISKMQNKQAQGKLYDYMLQNDPDAIDSMWKDMGLTASGMNNKKLAAFSEKDAKGKPTGRFNNVNFTPEQRAALKDAYADGYMGARTMRFKPKTNGLVQQYACTPTGVVAVKPGSAAAIPGGINGIYNSYDEAVAACTAKAADKPSNPYVTTAGEIGTDKTANVPFEYLAPDQFNMLAAVANPPKRYNPYIAPTKLTKPEPTFYDPARELAANAEMYNQTVAGAANFGNPQAFMANASKASGDALANAANIMGRYNNLNVGVANQFSPMQAEIDNKQAAMDADRATMLRQLYATTGQNMDNAKRDYLSRVAAANAKRFDNRMNTDLINQTIPQYYIDPRTGRTIFKGGYGPNSFSTALRSGSGLPQSDQDWAQLQADYQRHAAATGMTFAQYLNFRNTGRSTYTDSNNDGIPESSRTTVRR